MWRAGILLGAPALCYSPYWLAETLGVDVVCPRGLMFEETIRVRFPLIDLWLIFLVIIMLVLVVRELIY